jgi:ABC-type spermidine/putrescine transport system permease subunit I
MVILVDSSETARVWIEQSRLPLEVKPLLMVISAQAEPMVVPYYDSNQVQGMVTGLFGGANYELITNSPATARIFWDAFAVAFFVAEIIVVVGGVWALIAAWQARLARKDEEA